MTKDFIIASFLNDKSYKTACKRISGRLWKDLYQEVSLSLCEMDESRLIKAYDKGHLRWLIIRIMQNITNNKSRKGSRLNYITDNGCAIEDHYSKEDKSDAILFDILEKKLNEDEKTRWYEAKLLRAYMRHGSYRKLAKATGIPYNSISSSVQKYLKDLKPQLIDELKLQDIEKI